MSEMISGRMVKFKFSDNLCSKLGLMNTNGQRVESSRCFVPCPARGANGVTGRQIVLNVNIERARDVEV